MRASRRIDMRMLFVAVVSGAAVVLILALMPMYVIAKNATFQWMGKSVAWWAETLGGAYLKGIQVLSTRADLLPAPFLTELQRLRDSVRAQPFSVVECDSQSIVVDEKPIASATISQVHIGRCCGAGDELALKVRRPRIGNLLRADVRHIRSVANTVALLPWLRQVPLREATDEICTALLRQVDFQREASMLHRFRHLFSDEPRVHIPVTLDSYCSDDVIVMEYLDGFRPIPEYRESQEFARSAVETGLQALYRMIFEAGLIHCDLHPSNILCRDDGTIALIDFGFVAELTEQQRKEFAEFFLSIAFRDGQTAARIVKETALSAQDGLDETGFEKDMQVLLDKTAGRRANDFQVAGFVFELFQVQRKHGIYGSPHFTLPILSLLTYEGMIKDIHPQLDFQQEAVPFVMSSLGVPETTANSRS